MFRRYFRFLIPAILIVGIGAVLTAPWVSDIARADEDKSKPASKSPAGSKSKKKLDMSEAPADTKLEKKLLKDLGESFKIKRTLHYSIFYDTSEEDVAIFEHAIERTFRSCGKFCMNLGLEIHLPKKKMISYFFNEFQDYSNMKEKLGAGKAEPSNTGFYLPKNNYSYFYNFRNTPEFKKMRDDAVAKLADLGKQARGTKDPSQRRGIEEEVKKARWLINRTNSFGGGVTEETLQHEVAHQVLWNIGFHNPKEFMTNPRWFAEGIAQLFEPVTDSKGGNIGIVNKERLRNYQQLAEFNQLIPVKDFISTMQPFMRGDAGGLAYPQSWAMAHYLTRVKRAELKKYVELLLKRSKKYKSSPEEEVEAFEKCFGKIDRKWEKKWKDWMKNVR
jgi:hypothetical protein